MRFSADPKTPKCCPRKLFALCGNHLNSCPTQAKWVKVIFYLVFVVQSVMDKTPPQPISMTIKDERRAAPPPQPVSLNSDPLEFSLLYSLKCSPRIRPTTFFVPSPNSLVVLWSLDMEGTPSQKRMRKELVEAVSRRRAL